MENEMVERVAAAIRATCGPAVILDEPDVFIVDGEIGPAALARAAIEAMREPTARMLFAADDAAGDPATVNLVWAAMIDAALEPQKEQA